MSKPQITTTDIQTAATIIGCEPAVIQAVDEVESNGAGFLADGRLKILFEPHIFWKQLREQGINPEPYRQKYPGLLSPTWKKELYKVGGTSWEKLAIAITIHREAALRSASYGRYQVLGENFKMLGFVSAQALLNYLNASEANQLVTFINYVKIARLDDELRAKDWAGFARGYNGPLYHKNDYHGKLYRSYLKHRLKAKGATVLAMITGSKGKAA
jgi:hypothetical protein